MVRCWWYGWTALAVGLVACGDGTPARARDRASDGTPAGLAARLAATRPPEAQAGNGLAHQFAAIRDEYEAELKQASIESEKGKSDFERIQIYGRLVPDEAAFAHRMVDLAASDPLNPAARDAMVWVIDKPGMGPSGPYSDEFTRAVLLLLRNHADDPEVARASLALDNLCSPARDLLLEGLYVRTRGHEARGLATAALAQYLQQKSRMAAAFRNPDSPTKMKFRTLDEHGKLVEKEMELPQEELAYRIHLRMSDPQLIQAEARRLFDELIKDYGDVPYSTRQERQLEAILSQPQPSWNGRMLTPDEIQQGRRMLAHKRTLADAARARLDEMENLVAGKPAPPIGGLGMDGKPLKLADYRGKVVVLVFWGTWCGPCMQEVPHERELVERYKGRPFALLGVDCESNKAAALKVMKEQRITWPNWNDGDPGEGPIARAYHVRGYPTILVIDAKGMIRQLNAIGSALDKVLEDLLKETEAAVAGK